LEGTYNNHLVQLPDHFRADQKLKHVPTHPITGSQEEEISTSLLTSVLQEAVGHPSASFSPD